MKPALAALLLVLSLSGPTDPGACEGGETGCASAVIVREFRSGTLLGTFQFSQNGRFSLSFIHSVSGTPVRDDYRTLGDRIIQVAEVFEGHGAGLPSGTDEPGVIGWEHEDGKFVIRMERPIPRLIVRTDRIYENRLIIGGQTVDLNQWEDQALELTVAPCAEK